MYLPYIISFSIFCAGLIYEIYNYQSYVVECNDKGGVVIQVNQKHQCAKIDSITFINMDKK